jgi:hypothetical protein
MQTDLMGEVPSTLKRPTKRELGRFTTDGIGDDTVRTFLRGGFSLAICCRACLRLIEWTPPELDRRFGQRPDVKIAVVASRLLCAGDGGCGSHDIAVFPHLYDGDWRWTPR